MSSPSNPCLASANFGASELILILVFLVILAAMGIAFLGVIYLIIRAVLNRPPPSPASMSPDAITQQQRKDREHVKMLAIFHFVFGGLALAGIGFLCVHYAIMHTVFSNPQMWKSQPQNMPPKAFLDVFIWFYLFMGALLLTALVMNVLSGFFLLKKRNRLFSVIIGGLNCLQIPFGTVLGVFTILVLTRDSVRRLYDEDNPSRPMFLT